MGDYEREIQDNSNDCTIELINQYFNEKFNEFHDYPTENFSSYLNKCTQLLNEYPPEEWGPIFDQLTNYAKNGQLCPTEFLYNCFKLFQLSPPISAHLEIFLITSIGETDDFIENFAQTPLFSSFITIFSKPFGCWKHELLLLFLKESPEICDKIIQCNLIQYLFQTIISMSQNFPKINDSNFIDQLILVIIIFTELFQYSSLETFLSIHQSIFSFIEEQLKQFSQLHFGVLISLSRLITFFLQRVIQSNININLPNFPSFFLPLIIIAFQQQQFKNNPEFINSISLLISTFFLTPFRDATLSSEILPLIVDFESTLPFENFSMTSDVIKIRKTLYILFVSTLKVAPNFSSLLIQKGTIMRAANIIIQGSNCHLMIQSAFFISFFYSFHLNDFISYLIPFLNETKILPSLAEIALAENDDNKVSKNIIFMFINITYFIESTHDNSRFQTILDQFLDDSFDDFFSEEFDDDLIKLVIILHNQITDLIPQYPF